MTGPAGRPSYKVLPVAADFRPGETAAPWVAVPPLVIGHYLWLANGYAPAAEARLCWSPKFLYVRFRVKEKRVRVRYLTFQDPVYKDSCAEFFIDACPEKKLGYVNLETNAAGTLLAAFGPARDGRRPLRMEDLTGFEIASSIHGPVAGEYGAEAWTVEYRLPLDLFGRLYGLEIRPGRRAAANFYTCGDETEDPHYGAWAAVETPKPDFHRPEFFGELLFV